MFLVLKAACGVDLRWDCRGTEVPEIRPPRARSGTCEATSYGEGVEVRFFGEFEVVKGGEVVPVRGAKQRALLALLALHRGSRSVPNG